MRISASKSLMKSVLLCPELTETRRWKGFTYYLWNVIQYLIVQLMFWFMFAFTCHCCIFIEIKFYHNSIKWCYLSLSLPWFSWYWKRLNFEIQMLFSKAKWIRMQFEMSIDCLVWNNIDNISSQVFCYHREGYQNGDELADFP